KNIKANLEHNADEKVGFLIRVRPRVVKSGKWMVLCGWDGDLFDFEVPPEQAEAMGFPPGSDVDVHSVPYGEQLRKPRQFTVAALKIDNAAKFDPAKKITGSVVCKRLAVGEGNLALRLTLAGPKVGPGDGPVRGLSPVTEEFGKDDGTLQFAF